MQAHKNANRWSGFADTYDAVRPACPGVVVDVLQRYLGRVPKTVVDLGCGTGLSTLVWKGKARRVIGVDPSDDMRALAAARTAGCPGFEYVRAFSDCVPLPDGVADVVTCSQSFHWMEPVYTLAEVNRLLAPGGVFAAFDCDWPPVCSARVEMAYDVLLGKVKEIEGSEDAYKDAFIRYPKDRHLANIRASGHFSYAREVVFMNAEPCDAARYMGIAVSQGGVQAVLKREPERIQGELERFRSIVEEEFRTGRPESGTAGEKEILFCYRMRVGVK